MSASPPRKKLLSSSLNKPLPKAPDNSNDEPSHGRSSALLGVHKQSAQCPPAEQSAHAQDRIPQSTNDGTGEGNPKKPGTGSVSKTIGLNNSLGQLKSSRDAVAVDDHRTRGRKLHRHKVSDKSSSSYDTADTSIRKRNSSRIAAPAAAIGRKRLSLGQGGFQPKRGGQSTSARKTNTPKKSGHGNSLGDTKQSHRKVTSKRPGVVHRRYSASNNLPGRRDIIKKSNSPGNRSISPFKSSASPSVDFKQPRQTRTSLLRESMHSPARMGSPTDTHVAKHERTFEASGDGQQTRRFDPKGRRKSQIPLERRVARRESHMRLMYSTDSSDEAGKEERGRENCQGNQNLQLRKEVIDPHEPTFFNVVDGQVKERSMSEKKRQKILEKEIALQKNAPSRLGGGAASDAKATTDNKAPWFSNDLDIEADADEKVGLRGASAIGTVAVGVNKASADHLFQGSQEKPSLTSSTDGYRSGTAQPLIREKLSAFENRATEDTLNSTGQLNLLAIRNGLSNAPAERSIASPDHTEPSRCALDDPGIQLDVGAHSRFDGQNNKACHQDILREGDKSVVMRGASASSDLTTKVYSTDCGEAVESRDVQEDIQIQRSQPPSRRAVMTKDLRKLADQAAVRSRSNSAVDSANAGKEEETLRPLTSHGMQPKPLGGRRASKGIRSIDRNFAEAAKRLLEGDNQALSDHPRTALIARSEDPFTDHRPKSHSSQSREASDTAGRTHEKAKILSEGAWISSQSSKHEDIHGEPRPVDIISPISATGDHVSPSPISAMRPGTDTGSYAASGSVLGEGDHKFGNSWPRSTKGNNHVKDGLSQKSPLHLDTGIGKVIYRHPSRTSSRSPVPDLTLRMSASNSSIVPFKGAKAKSSLEEPTLAQEFSARQQRLGESSGIFTRGINLSPNSVFDQNKVGCLNSRSSQGQLSNTSSTSNTKPAQRVIDSVRGIFKRNAADHSVQSSPAGKEQRSRHRPQIITTAQGSPFPDMSRVHPVHRPVLASPLPRSSPTATSPLEILDVDVPVTPATPSAEQMELDCASDVAQLVLRMASQSRGTNRSKELVMLANALISAISRANQASLLVEMGQREVRKAVVDHMLCVQSVAQVTNYVKYLCETMEEDQGRHGL